MAPVMPSSAIVMALVAMPTVSAVSAIVAIKGGAVDFLLHFPLVHAVPSLGFLWHREVKSRNDGQGSCACC